MFRNVTKVFQITRSTYCTHLESLSTPTGYQPLANKEETKLLKVAIIGVPNVGKSTLINQLLDRKVCATSSKVHTTRNKSMAIFTESAAQIVFLDTPGLVNIKERNRYNLERSFTKDSKTCLEQADLIGVVHDVSNVHTRDKLDIKIIRLLEENAAKPSFLVFNKVDLLRSKRKLLDITRQVTNNHLDGAPIGSVRGLKFEDRDQRTWPHFREIFMVSALSGVGLADVRGYLLGSAKPSEWMFPGEVWTDQTREQLILQSVKAKLMDFLPQEIPYQLRPELEFLDVNAKGVITTVVLVKCPSERMAKLVAGVSDGKLKQINESLQHDLQDTFQNYVRVKIVLEVENK